MRKLLPLLAIILIVWLSRGVAYRQGLEPRDPETSGRITVTVPEGASLAAIAGQLREAGIIRSAWAFERYANRQGLAQSLQAGTFTLSPSMTAADVVRVLRTGGGEQVTLTIPEGFTVEDIDRLLTGKGLITRGEFTACARTCAFDHSFLPPLSLQMAARGGRLEGYLYPDTYFVNPAEFTPQSFADRLLKTFQTKVVDALQKQLTAADHPLHAVVTVASLVEEETRTAEERPVVAGILWKRLSEGMRLDVDAALRYAIGKSTDAITRADLEVDSPYNLRRVRGLPPGPIASPGLASIRAALAPQPSPYYYYLHGSDGRIRYARTNEEHNQNRARYLP